MQNLDGEEKESSLCLKLPFLILKTVTRVVTLPYTNKSHFKDTLIPDSGKLHISISWMEAFKEGTIS